MSDDGIGEYYARIDREKRAAWDVVRMVETFMADGNYVVAIGIIKKYVSPITYFSIIDTCKSGLEMLRERAIDAGNTGD